MMSQKHRVKHHNQSLGVEVTVEIKILFSLFCKQQVSSLVHVYYTGGRSADCQAN